MRKIHYLIIVITSSIVCIVLSCQNDGTTTADEYTNRYYKRELLNNIYENEIIPLHQQFSTETQTLLNEVLSFSNDINSDNLIQLKQQWKVATSVWKKCELYDIGAIKNSFIHYAINSWPANTSFIENNIASTTIVNESYIASIGSSSKGIAGIEYLLFNSDEGITISAFQDSPSRLNYLIACIAELNTNSDTILNQWIVYHNVFVTNIQEGISGSQNEIINNMVALLEEIIMSKLNNAINQNDNTEFEAFKSDFSLEMIKSNIIALQRCYTGDFSFTPYRIGYKKILTELGNEELANEIDEKFNSCILNIATMNPSLNNSLNNNVEEINELKIDVEALLFLIKIEMSQVIGSTITFNDNDGD